MPATSLLSDIRIADMTTVIFGPYCTQTMADMGAEVIKLEPEAGDTFRNVGKPANNRGMGPCHMTINRGKRSVVWDLKSDTGKAAIRKLIEVSDVFIHNIRPDAVARLGLTFEDVKAIRPDIVYVHCLGFGTEGPYAGRPAYDDLIQGGACIPYLFQKAGRKPAYVPAAICDRIVGMSAVNAILAAVIERDRSGQGQKVEVPMYETMLAMILADPLGGLTFVPPLDQGGYRRHLSPDRKPYETRDGHVCALIYNDGHWERFFRELGRPEMPKADPRYATFAARMAHIDEVYAELGELMKTRIDRLNHPRIHSQIPPSRTSHVIGNVLVEEADETAGEYLISSNFNMTEYRLQNQRIFAGRYLHRLKKNGAGFASSWKKVELINCDAPFGVIAVPI